MDRYAGLEQKSFPDDAMVGYVVEELVYLCQIRNKWVPVKVKLTQTHLPHGDHVLHTQVAKYHDQNIVTEIVKLRLSFIFGP